MPHLLVRKRWFLYYSKGYSDVTKRWLLAWNQKSISSTNCKFCSYLPDNSKDLLPANKYN